MRIRRALAVPGAAVLTTLLAASGARAAVAAPAVCAEGSVRVTASAGATAHVIRIRVTNESRAACVVDRIPAVTFGTLDGSARPVPPSRSAPYRLAAGYSGYAAVRTLDPAAEQSRTVADVYVAGDPSHRGTRFIAASVGAPRGVRVWDPVTTLWQPTRAAADAALDRATR
ncbi:DUF4232 domain-containing protein, partial [Streptomyces sp. NPDC087850]|uniref:DUF4232 domain-containing protein n=1 Tax=Streptomyces sp. NPDC087850 TaxID=3365809 RepID=UPI003810994D